MQQSSALEPHVARRPHESAQRSLFQLAGPMLVEMVLMHLVGLLGLWLVSRISDDTAAIYAMINHLVFSFMMLFRIISVGAGVVVAQHLGGQDPRGAQLIAKTSLICNTWVGLICAALMALMATPLLRWMQLPEALMAQAVPYLRVMAICLFFDAGIFIFTTILRAYQLTRLTLWLTLATQLAGLVVAVPLMLGWWGLPVWGLWGLIAGQVLCRVLAWGLGAALWRRKLAIHWIWRDAWQWRADALRSILHIGLPGAGEALAYRASFMVIMAMVASMGAATIATHSYTFQVMTFILLFSLALGLSTEIVVGHAVGAGRLHHADQVVRIALRWGLGGSLGLSLVMALAGPRLMAVFSSDPHIIEVGARLLWLCLLVESGRCFNLIVINGLRAAGDVRFPLAAGISSMVVVAVGVAWLLGVHWGWGLTGVWLAYAADEWLRGLMMYARWRSRRWLIYSRQAHRRIRRKRRDNPPIATPLEPGAELQPTA
jgi:putative MATE family efflux protein